MSITGTDAAVVKVQGELVEVFSLRGTPLSVGDWVRVCRGSGAALFGDPVPSPSTIAIRAFGLIPAVLSIIWDTGGI